MKPTALVIPWFGKNLKGGAEQLAWQVSTRLAARGHNIEVLTTCCISFLQDWSTNHLPAGVERHGEVLVRRFKVDKRNGDIFNKANNHGLSFPQKNLRPGINPFSFGTGEQFVAENINSIALERYLKRNRKKYHCFIFLPYLYGVILYGLPLVAEKSWLQPCLHDEVYAYLPEVEQCMRSSKGILYNSLGEEKLALSLFGPGILRKGEVVGVGVEGLGVEREELPRVVGGLDLQHEAYILCLGRRDKTKNTTLLVEAFKTFREDYPESRMNLILAGPGEGRFGKEVAGVYDMGLVSEEEKEALLANCTALFQPSKNESYSRVIMEAWFYGRPVAAHKMCLATSLAVQAAEGGWLADSVNEWSRLFRQIELLDNSELSKVGQLGRNYAEQYADWDTVINRYETVLGLKPDHLVSGVKKSKPIVPVVHQLTAGFAYGDAISNQAITIRNILQEMGYQSKIFTEHIDPSMSHEAHLFNNGNRIKKSDGLLYHHSIGAGLTDFVIQHPGKKLLIYHNVTPPDMVRKADPALALKLEQGLADLERLAPHFSLSAGDSCFNSDDLKNNGFKNPSVLPICVSPEKWNIVAEPNMMARLQDGRDNILFVGRIVANKCQHDLIDVFSCYQSVYGNARLILVGGFVEEENYYQQLQSKVREKGLEGNVLFTGKIPENILHACYRCADLFLSMSEHEGFGVPLVEAMWFNVPVLAYKSSAVPETLGEGGLLFTDKSNANYLAAVMKLLIHDSEIKSKILLGQQRRREAFLPKAIRLELNKLLRGMHEE